MLLELLLGKPLLIQVFFILKICFSLPKSLYFLRISTCNNHPILLEKYDKTVRNRLSYVCNVNFDSISSIFLGSLGVSSASILARPAFLATVFGSGGFLTKFVSETSENGSFIKALEK